MPPAFAESWQCAEDGTADRGSCVAELTDMVNIGREMARKLASVGVDSPEKLVELGSKHAFFRIKERYSQVCLVHLYALEGAIQGVEFNSLSKEQKRDLREFSDCLKG